MCLVRIHGESDRGGPHGFFAAVNRETGEEETGWYLEAVRGQDQSRGGRYSVHMVIYLQAPSNGGTVGGPLSHILSLLTGDRV